MVNAILNIVLQYLFIQTWQNFGKLTVTKYSQPKTLASLSSFTFHNYLQLASYSYSFVNQTLPFVVASMDKIAYRASIIAAEPRGLLATGIKPNLNCNQ